MYVQDVVATAEAMHAFGGLHKFSMLRGKKTKGLGFGLLTTKFGNFLFLVIVFLLLFIVKISHEFLK